jgi:hypothetical protein
MKLLFPAIALGLLSFLTWGAIKPWQRHLGALQQLRHKATEESSESMDDPKLAPLRDPWDRKWQI